MSESPISSTKVRHVAMIRRDQARFIQFIARRLSASAADVTRWMLDVGYTEMLRRAGLADTDIPEDARPPSHTSP